MKPPEKPQIPHGPSYHEIIRYNLDLVQYYIDLDLFLNKFLEDCREHGYEVVSFGMKTQLIPATLTWPFHHATSIFAKPIEKDGGRINNWPAIWHICEENGCGRSCGNSHQKQCNFGILRVYKLNKKTGQWSCVDSENQDSNLSAST
jgi:hypothetical protein